MTEYSSVTIQGNPCQNQLELANTLPQLYTKVKLIQRSTHLNVINVCNNAISKRSGQCNKPDTKEKECVEYLNVTSEEEENQTMMIRVKVLVEKQSVKRAMILSAMNEM